ncbi:MAG: hypothetical protein IJH59_01205 [Firmicutes bacterium]|nr:hypothetical protein [Bacillota bacterium]
MRKKTAAILYATSSLLLLACPYAVPTLYRYVDYIASRMFRIIPKLIFMYAAALLLPLLLVLHVYFFHRLELPRKRLMELGLCAVFGLAAPLIYFYVIHFPHIWTLSSMVCCFLFVFTLLTALLFGKKAEPAP